MATSNHTPTIELSQYISTDKTSYLVNYNDDMLKIDGAIAADRDDINTAQNTADTAEGKADTNKLSIDAINETLNDNTTGVLKRLGDVEGDVNTIESLIGNGEPTTSDKTIIGAINELAGDNATVVDAINGIGCSIRNFNQSAFVTADGVKTSKELIEEAIDAFIAASEALTDCYVEVTRLLWWDLPMYPAEHNVYSTNSPIDYGGGFHITNINAAHTNVLIRDVDVAHGDITDASQVIFTLATNTAAYSDGAVEVPAAGVRFGVNYRVYYKETRIS